LVQEKKDVVELLAQRLLEKETIVLKDLHEILGSREHDMGEEMNH
jgi:ATP-dependent Zn protease